MNDTIQDIRTRVARALLEIEALIFNPGAPITFKSGIKSPVYVDNRRLPFWPAQWRAVIDGFHQMIMIENLPFDVIAGIETAGIPHSAALAYAMHKPSVFVRKQPKDHGTQKRVEGGDVAGKRVLLIEDLITTGGSSLSGVEALRAEGATVEHCLCIISYDFVEAQQAFAAAKMQLHALAPFASIIAEAVWLGKFEPPQLAIIEAWMRDPRGWAGQA